MEIPAIPALESFSLVKGGPLYRLMLRVRLVTGESYLPMAIFFVVLTWLPLLVLSVWQGSGTGAHVRITFLRDFAVQARLLISLPILIIADAFVDPRLRVAMRQFVRSNLIAPADVPRFEYAIRTLPGWRDSALAEAAIVLFAVVHAYFALSKHGWYSATLSSWYAIPGPEGRILTPAGWWLQVSLSISLFFLGRWLWRLLVWARLLSQINGLNLQLIPTHPDRAGGLAFVGKSQTRFGFVVFAVCAAGAGTCANWIVFEGETLRSLESVILAYLLIAMAVFMSPALLFTGRLYELKKKGQLEYGALAMEYVQLFDSKWLRGSASREETFLGSKDIRSLADLAISFDVVRQMGIVVLDRKAVLAFLASATIPFLPLLLTVLPLRDLIKEAWKMLF